jgi:hypothetical protein
MLHGIARRTEIRDFVWFLVYVGLGEKEPFATYLADYLQRNTTTLWEREGGNGSHLRRFLQERLSKKYL